MAHTLIVHLVDQDAVVGEVAVLPAAGDISVRLSNPRRMDGNELNYLAVGVVEAIWPMARINFIEIMPSEDETIIGFVRD